MFLRLFVNNLAGFFKVSRNPIPWLASALVETEIGQNTGSYMPFFVSVRKSVGSVLTSSVTFNLTQVKVKGRHASQNELYILKKNYPHSKTPL